MPLANAVALISLIVGAIACAAIFLTSISRRRSDKSWKQVVLAGPLVAIYPERYLDSAGMRRMPVLVATAILAFVVAAFSATLVPY